MDIVKHNQAAWDNYVEKANQWTVPVSEQEIEEARKGQWEIVLTPLLAVPRAWFPEMKGLKILGLACGGGQQGPVMAASGADVTIFDNSSRQLSQDKTLSDRFHLNIKTIQGDMKDLSVFDDNTFDLIFNPCSVVFVDDVIQVWKESYRILKPGGILMTGLINPLMYQLVNINGEFKLVHKQPYSDLKSLPQEASDNLIRKREALEFGHSFTDQIGGQLQAGFVITDMYEDFGSGEPGLDDFFPAFMATRAVKKGR